MWEDLCFQNMLVILLSCPPGKGPREPLRRAEIQLCPKDPVQLLFSYRGHATIWFCKISLGRRCPRCRQRVQTLGGEGGSCIWGGRGEGKVLRPCVVLFLSLGDSSLGMHFIVSAMRRVTTFQPTTDHVYHSCLLRLSRRRKTPLGDVVATTMPWRSMWLPCLQGCWCKQAYTWPLESKHSTHSYARGLSHPGPCECVVQCSHRAKSPNVAFLERVPVVQRRVTVLVKRTHAF